MSAVTIDDVFALFKEADRRARATELQLAESDRRFKDALEAQARETERRAAEADKRLAETERFVKSVSQDVKRVSQDIGRLGNRLGEWVEATVKPAAVSSCTLLQDCPFSENWMRPSL